jgi:hypothetical protein
VADAIRAIGVTEVRCDRKLATTLHYQAPACLAGRPATGSGSDLPPAPEVFVPAFDA